MVYIHTQVHTYYIFVTWDRLQAICIMELRDPHVRKTDLSLTPVQQGLPFVICHGEEAAVWREVQALREIHSLLPKHGVVGKHREAGDVDLNTFKTKNGL